MKKETLRLFFGIAAFFCWLSLMSVACDPACHDKFYLKNTLDTPITYSQFNTKDSTQRNIVTIQPGESKIYIFGYTHIDEYNEEYVSKEKNGKETDWFFISRIKNYR